MARQRRDAAGFGSFFRRYTRTWVHAVATAALTGLGILTFLHPYFAVLAVAAYVLPPVAMYLGGSSAATTREADHDGGRPVDPDVDERRAGSADDRDEPSEAADGPTPAWRSATAPADETLHDVAMADERAYAVGADGVVVVGDGSVPVDDGERWTTVLDDGPRARSNTLECVDAVRDGGVWFAGGGGAVGRVDPATDRHVDYSAPDGDTSTITDVAAALSADGETVLLGDGSGRVRRGRYLDGALAWDEPVTPGSGSSVTGIAMVDGSVGYVCDSNQHVFRTSDGGRSFDRIGLDAANGTLSDVGAIDDGGCTVSAADGVCHRFDGTTWTPRSLGDDALRAIAVRGDRRLACGDGGTVYECGDENADWTGGRRGDTTGWRRRVTPTSVPLRGCALGESTAVAVGDGGTVVERTLDSPFADTGCE